MRFSALHEMIGKMPTVKHVCGLPNMVNAALITAMFLGSGLLLVLTNAVTSLPPPGQMVASAQAEARAVIIEAVRIDFSQAPPAPPDPETGEKRRIIVLE
jgi:hypothetical protein